MNELQRIRQGALPRAPGEKELIKDTGWAERAQKGFLASGIDPLDRRGYKNDYIDLLQKAALEEVLELRGDEVVLDFGCGSGRVSHWIAPRVKRVIGLEVTPEMIEMAKENRVTDNVEFMLYDGFHFPALPVPIDLIFSIGVLQIMELERLKEALSQLKKYLKSGGKLYLIEQASDNPKVGRLPVQHYLRAFEDTGLTCLRYYPIRRGRWWGLYLIRYGIVPRILFPKIAQKEILLRRREARPGSYYKDYLFVLKAVGFKRNG